MSDVADYDADILLWSERQAALLRALKERVRGLPNELDLENVAEEIESVGRTEFRAASSFLSLIFSHAIKASAYPDSDAVPHWLSEMRTFHGQYLLAVTPAMRVRFDCEKLWRKALRDQLANMADRGEPTPKLPTMCPFTLGDFEDEAFDARRMVAELSKNAVSDRSLRPAI